MKLTGYILMMEDGSMKYTTTDKTNKEPEFNGKKVKDRKVRVIPGFHLTLGITVTMLSLIVLIPLASVMVYSLKLSPGEFMALVTKKNVVNAFITSISCSFISAVINCIFGTILAWTFVKYDFTCKRILDGLIELPFALPTAVAGHNTFKAVFRDRNVRKASCIAWNKGFIYTYRTCYCLSIRWYTFCSKSCNTSS